MAAARDPHDENIRALEQLRAGSGEKPPARRASAAVPPKPSDEPIFPELPANAPAPPPTPPLPSRRPMPQVPLRARSDDSAPTYHCLECGYALLAQSGYRCSECGKTYDPGFLSAWFEGTEQDRFNHLTFLVTIACIVKVYAFLMIAFAPMNYQQTCVNLLIVVAGAGVSLTACVLAGRDRMDTIAGYYAMAGSAAAGLAGLGVLLGGLRSESTFVWPAMVFAMDALSGAMLLLTLLYPVKGIHFWRARPLRKVVLPIAIGLFPIVFILYTLEMRYRESVTATGGTIPGILLVVNTTALSAAASLAMWFVARHWIVSFRRAVFSTARDSDEDQE
jgi:hypothetical protein